KVNPYGKKICHFSFPLNIKNGKLIGNCLELKPGIKLNNGPIIESVNNLYLKYKYNPSNVGFLEPKVNMFVIIEYYKVQCEYIIIELEENYGRAKFFTGC